MANSTGKAARKQFGTRSAAKRSKKKRQRGPFGKLPLSVAYHPEAVESFNRRAQREGVAA